MKQIEIKRMTHTVRVAVSDGGQKVMLTLTPVTAERVGQAMVNAATSDAVGRGRVFGAPPPESPPPPEPTPPPQEKGGGA